MKTPSRSAASRRLSLSVVMIRRLNAGLGNPAEILILPYKTGRAA
jgi:hypothetical protein